jgi:hypothetical protein
VHPLGQRAHAAHHQFFQKSADSAMAVSPAPVAPSRTLDPTSPAVLELLERLDDTVYQAISGQAAALEELETLWPMVLAELGEPLVAESREQYLRYALAIWHDGVEPGAIRNPARALQALDVLCVLFNETR